MNRAKNNNQKPDTSKTKQSEKAYFGKTSQVAWTWEILLKGCVCVCDWKQLSLIKRPGTMNKEVSEWVQCCCGPSWEVELNVLIDLTTLLCLKNLQLYPRLVQSAGDSFWKCSLNVFLQQTNNITILNPFMLNGYLVKMICTEMLTHQNECVDVILCV